MTHSAKFWNFLDERRTTAKKNNVCQIFPRPPNQCWSLFPALWSFRVWSTLCRGEGGKFYLGLGCSKIRQKRPSVSLLLKPIVAQRHSFLYLTHRFSISQNHGRSRGSANGRQTKTKMFRLWDSVRRTARFTWLSILKYDDEFRHLQAAYRYPWCFDSNHLHTVTLQPISPGEGSSKSAGTASKPSPSNSPASFTADGRIICRNFNRSRCSCNFAHVCNRKVNGKACGLQHPSTQHTSSPPETPNHKQCIWRTFLRRVIDQIITAKYLPGAQNEVADAISHLHDPSHLQGFYSHLQLFIQEAADRQRTAAAAVPTTSAAPEVLYDKYYQLVIID